MTTKTTTTTNSALGDVDDSVVGVGVVVKPDLSRVWALADEAVRGGARARPRPDFPIPAGAPVGEELAEVRDMDRGGRGLFAKRSLAAGTTVLVAKPLAWVLDWELEDDDDDDDETEDDDDDDEDDGVVRVTRRVGALISRVADRIAADPSTWRDRVSRLHPRTDADVGGRRWVCEDAATAREIERALNALANDDDVASIRRRLPFVVRYNCLSVETAPELLVHPDADAGGHVRLSGTGLYFAPSFFDHSADPNVARYAVGDLAFFVLNRNVERGDELRISYLEAEHLCETPKLRSCLLDADFYDDDDDDDDENDLRPRKDYEGRFPMIDVDAEEQLLALPPVERSRELRELTTMAEKGREDNDPANDDLPYWFRSDAHRLRVLLAHTRDVLGTPAAALDTWDACVAFVEDRLPPGDESLVVLRARAARSAAVAGRPDEARRRAAAALAVHDALFGGGAALLRRRLAPEFSSWPASTGPNASTGERSARALWPLPDDERP